MLLTTCCCVEAAPPPPPPPPDERACCYPDGSCVNTFNQFDRARCLALGGIVFPSPLNCAAVIAQELCLPCPDCEAGAWPSPFPIGLSVSKRAMADTFWGGTADAVVNLINNKASVAQSDFCESYELIAVAGATVEFTVEISASQFQPPIGAPTIRVAFGVTPTDPVVGREFFAGGADFLLTDSNPDPFDNDYNCDDSIAVHFFSVSPNTLLDFNGASIN